MRHCLLRDIVSPDRLPTQKHSLLGVIAQSHSTFDLINNNGVISIQAWER